ncbi:hypothetical protein G5I_13180 [Acromyrmex echinatior]|uniref:Uncharacterized protein n=1 Tax=Acromyrmex echinatior TaxID=103372 RepID=F4X4C0_ACREC|nr:hypothetical protein G5I_13180 [Acromyrmex echinatior]
MARDSRRADPRRVVAVNGGGGGGDGGATVRCKLELILLTLLLTIIIPTAYAESQVWTHVQVSLELVIFSFFSECSTSREGTDKKTLKLLEVRHFVKSIVCTIYHINAEWFFEYPDVATIRRSILDLVNRPMVTGRSMRCNPDEYCYHDCISADDIGRWHNSVDTRDVSVANYPNYTLHHYSGLSAFLISFREKSTASSPPTTANKAFLAAGGHDDATMHRDHSKKAYVKAMGNDAVHLRVMYVLGVRRSALDIDLYNIKNNVKFIINMAKVNMPSVEKYVEKHMSPYRTCPLVLVLICARTFNVSYDKWSALLHPFATVTSRVRHLKMDSRDSAVKSRQKGTNVSKSVVRSQMDAISFTPLSRTFVKTFMNSPRLSQVLEFIIYLLPKNGTRRLIILEHAKQTYLKIRLATRSDECSFSHFSPFLKHTLLTHVEIIVTHLPLDSFQVGFYRHFIQASKIINLFHLTLPIVTIPTFIIDNIILRIFEELHDWLNDDKVIIRRQYSAYKATTFPFTVRSPASLSLTGACRATALYCVARCIQAKLNFGMETDIEIKCIEKKIDLVLAEYHMSYRKRGKGYEGNGKADGDFYLL